MGTFLLACWTGGMEGSRWMVYIAGILPVVLKDLGKAFLRKMMPHTSCMAEWSCQGLISCTEWSWKGPRGHWWSWKGVIFYITGSWKGAIFEWSCDGFTDLREWFWLLLTSFLLFEWCILLHGRSEGDVLQLTDVGDGISDCGEGCFLWYFEFSDTWVYWCRVWKEGMGSHHILKHV